MTRAGTAQTGAGVDRPLDRRQVLRAAGVVSSGLLLAACAPDSPAPQATLTQRIVGNPRPDGFDVTCRSSNALGVSLLVAADEQLTDAVVRSTSAEPDDDGWSTLSVSGLRPDTEYHWDVLLEEEGVETAFGRPQRLRTLPRPGEPASFSFAFGSCMTNGSRFRRVMDRILEREPTLFLHLGDFGYFDNDSERVGAHRNNFERQLEANAGLREVLSSIPTVYIQSDHDAGGGNNSGPGPWTEANRAAYRQVFPHPDNGEHPDGLYWSIPVGRVLLVFTDHKTYASRQDRRDDDRKSMLGREQKEWFFDQLRRDEPVKIWVQHSAFIDDEVDTDKWGNYATEQREIADFIADDAVGEVLTVHGDMHAVAVSTENPWGLRSWCAAPFDQQSSIKAGFWTQGPYPEREDRAARQYGLVEVTDDGEVIELRFGGYDDEDVERVGDRLRVDTASG
jgi:phosphodiesterase/alkaline phosphatase D-like protein